MLDKDARQRINSARQILVGKVPDPKAQVEQITNALIYKFMDDMDRDSEELGGKAQFLAGGLKEFSWGRLMSLELSGTQRWDLYTRGLDAFAKSEQIPELFRTIFKGAYLPYRDPETLNLFLKEINGFSHSNSENLGNAFEYLLSILGSQGDAGQFCTPRHIIDFIVEVVNPQKDERILDPACGTAGFLISSYKHIWRENSSNYKAKEYVPTFAEKESTDMSTVEIQKNGRYNGAKLNPDDRTRLARNIVGYDISPDMVRLSLVNLYPHGFSTPQIYEYDTLTYEERWGDNFDIILANPPFMTPRGGIRPHKIFQVSANRAEVLFVDYIAEHLALHGRAGIIVPEGIIFQSANAYKALRKMLIEENCLYAVVSLPAGVFQPYSGVKTSILFFDKQLAKKNDEILFVKVENDGFDLGAQRRRIDKNDLPVAFEILRDWQQGKKIESKLALWVKKEKIAENGDYNLTGDRYREAVDYSGVKWPMVELGEVCEVFIDGDWVESKDQSKDGIRLIQTGNIGNGLYLDKPDKARFISKNTFKKLNCNEVFPGDILVSRLPEPVGRSCIIPTLDSKIITAVDCTIIRMNKSIILSSYLLYLTKGKEYYKEVNQYLTGSSRKRISRKNLGKIQIPLPPLEVQKEIVAELDSYQKVVNGARQVAENWKPRIKINPDWQMVRLGEVCTPEYGYTDTAKDSANTRFIRITDIDSDGAIINSEPKFINISKNAEKYILQKGDLLVARTGATFGKTALFKEDGLAVFASFLIRLKFPKNKILPEFYWVFSWSLDYWNQANNLVTGGGQPQFNGNAIKQIQIPLPPLETQKEIIAKIEKEQKMVEECKKLIIIHEQKIKNRIAEVWGE